MTIFCKAPYCVHPSIRALSNQFCWNIVKISFHHPNDKGYIYKRIHNNQPLQRIHKSKPLERNDIGITITMGGINRVDNTKKLISFFLFSLKL